MKTAKCFYTSALLSIVLFSVFFFAIEPAKTFLIENTLETQFYEIENFKRLYNSLNNKKTKYKEILYVNERLNTLISEKRGFVLRDEARLLLAQSYERLGRTKEAFQIYNEILSDSNDKMVKVDALLKVIDSTKKRSKKSALQIAKNYESIVKNYKKNEFYSGLSDLYFETGNISKAGETILKLLPSKEDNGIYERILEASWKKYTTEEKKIILKNLISSGNYSLYQRYAIKYVKSSQPADKEIEEIGLNIINNCERDKAEELLRTINLTPLYTGIYYELKTFLNLSDASIKSHSARVRGEYYYRQLKRFNKKGRYNEEKASKIYENFIAGEIELDGVKKNLMILVRNLLAFKKYEHLAEATERTEALLNLNPDYELIAQDVSFWTGYSYFMLGDKTNSLRYFQKAVSSIPDSYFALYAKSYIEEILSQSGIEIKNYLASLKERYEKSGDYREKIFYGRLLFGLDEYNKKEYWKNEVVALMKRYYPDVFFDFDDNLLKRLKENSDAYIKFLVYTRFGMLEKAEALLSDLDINDKIARDILILKELLRNKDFAKARKYYDEIGEVSFINENFAFFSKELQFILYPTPYDAEIKVALSKLQETSLDKYLVYAVIRGESMYISRSRSRRGARGLMQLMPATARLINRSVNLGKELDLYNPLDNIILGTAYLNDIIQSHGLLKGLAFYNGGPGSVNKIKKNFFPENEIELVEIHPYRETRAYVKKILTNYLRYKMLYDNKEMTLSINNQQKKKIL
ncbi:MAG: transglycosylase SLT domain-containing protein [Brevinematia bacterium]